MSTMRAVVGSMCGLLLWVPGAAQAGPVQAGFVVCDVDDDGDGDLVFVGDGSNRVNLIENGASVGTAFHGTGGNTWGAIDCAATTSVGVASDAPSVGAARVQTLNTDGTVQSTSFVATGGGIWNLDRMIDLDGDGDDDAVYVGVSGGALGLIRLDEYQNGAPTGTRGFRPTAGGFWELTHDGDPNGDGMRDLIFQSDSSVRVDFMNGLNVLSQGFLQNGGGAWRVVAVGDASGDNKDDLWWEGQDGTPAENVTRLQEMDGATVLSTIFPQTGGGTLTPMFMADSNGDGFDDLFLAGASTNRLDVMSTSAFAISVARFFGNGGGGYLPARTGDFNKDGKQDLASEGAGDVLIQLIDGDMSNPVIGTGSIPNGGGFWDLLLDP